MTVKPPVVEQSSLTDVFFAVLLLIFSRRAAYKILESHSFIVKPCDDRPGSDYNELL